MPFERTVTDPVKVQRLYNTLQALPDMPRGTMSCPIDFGVLYQLTFYGPATQPVRVDVQPGGCEGVNFVGTSGPLKWLARTPQFWAQFADTLGVPASAIYPVVPPSIAPPVPTAAS